MSDDLETNIRRFTGHKTRAPVRSAWSPVANIVCIALAFTLFTILTKPGLIVSAGVGVVAVAAMVWSASK